MGQGRLLLAERFPQFRGLVARSREGELVARSKEGDQETGQVARSREGADEEAGPAVQLADLQGFWEMIFIQVARVSRVVAREDSRVYSKLVWKYITLSILKEIPVIPLLDSS